ncbi:MAG: competence/damage-inducible protein A, partial [Clostridiales bacterium]|nr:competence/damage-inducible protein A [Clostridiales bacterium]
MQMIAEILSVGTELLMGQIANTDAQFISRRLGELGVTIYRHSTVGDNPARVREALQEALSRSDMVITTGGLGPTEDDLTKEMVAEYFGLEMELHQPSLDALKAFMERFGKKMTPNNLKQAYFPRGCTVMPNACGTAPGCIVEQGGKTVAVLPGPPMELMDMFDRQLAPYLQARSGQVIRSRFLKIFGLGESNVETLLSDLFHSGNPTLALYCGPGEVTARITARAAAPEKAEAMMQPVYEEILRRVGEAYYGEGVNRTPADAVLELLKNRGETVTFAESCTGGLLCGAFVDCAGASDCLKESFVTYANEAKENLLGVKSETLARCGAVSGECAREMALGAARAAGADWAVSVTGIAGPGGGTAEKPVGTVWIGVAHGGAAQAREYHFRGQRQWIRKLSVVNALNQL